MYVCIGMRQGDDLQDVMKLNYVWLVERDLLYNTIKYTL